MKVQIGERVPDTFPLAQAPSLPLAVTAQSQGRFFELCASSFLPAITLTPEALKELYDSHSVSGLLLAYKSLSSDFSRLKASECYWSGVRAQVPLADYYIRLLKDSTEDNLYENMLNCIRNRYDQQVIGPTDISENCIVFSVNEALSVLSIQSELLFPCADFELNYTNDLEIVPSQLVSRLRSQKQGNFQRGVLVLENGAVAPVAWNEVNERTILGIWVVGALDSAVNGLPALPLVWAACVEFLDRFPLNVSFLLFSLSHPSCLYQVAARGALEWRTHTCSVDIHRDSAEFSAEFTMNFEDKLKSGGSSTCLQSCYSDEISKESLLIELQMKIRRCSSIGTVPKIQYESSDSSDEEDAVKLIEMKYLNMYN